MEQMDPELLKFLLSQGQLPANMNTQFGPVNSEVPQAPPQQPGFRERLQGLLGTGFDDPRTQGLLGLGSALLQASGPSTMPVSTGQALGQGLGAYSQARNTQQNNVFARNLAQEKLKYGLDSSIPAGIREWAQYSRMDPDTQRKYREMKRGEPWLNVGGSFTNPYSNMSIPKTLSPEQRPDTKREQTLAVKNAEAEAEKSANQPKAEAALSAAGTKNVMLGNLIQQAKGQANAFTTGFIGSLSQNIPGTQAHDLQNTLETIKANIGFDKLQEMRNSSKTGGALGQVSEFENRLLQSVWGALMQSQTKEQFLQNLDRVDKQVNESWARVREAYQKDYGKPYVDSTPGSSSPRVRKFNPATGKIE